MHKFKIGDKVKLEAWDEYLPIVAVKQSDILVREDDDVAWYNTNQFNFTKEQDMQNAQQDQHAFQAGDTVWCVIYGEGKVTKVYDNGEPYSITVEFAGVNEQYYTSDGKYYVAGNRCLYFSEPKVEASITRPFVSKLIGKKVLVVTNEGTVLRTIAEETTDRIRFVGFLGYADKQEISAIYEIASENLLSN